MVKRRLSRAGKRNRCRFCNPEDPNQVPVVDYKDIQSLKKLTTAQGKMFGRKRSGNCAGHQRQVKRAIKLARFMALLPYVGE